jgi:cytochrome P450
MKLNPDGFLAGLNRRYSEGIFSLNLLGSVHTFVARPSLVTHLMSLPESIASSEWMQMRLMYTNFGFRKGDSEELARKTYELYHALSSTPSLDKMTKTTIKTLNHNIADWVTFNSQPADQTEWEQVAEADVVEDAQGDNVVEADLRELTRSFVARVATPSVFGTDFCDNFPDFAQYIWILDQHFVLLASGLPAWVPYRPLQLGRAAKRKLLAYLEEYHTELEKVANGEDPDPKWENLDNVSSFMKARLELFRKEGASIRVRAALDLGFLWAMNANSAPLVFWMLYEINRDPVLLEQIRDEIVPYMDVVQPKNDFGLAVWMAPELRHVDIDGLMEKCPLLKASYLETLRLYTGSYAIKWMKEDAVLGKHSNAEGGGYLLKKGTFAHASHELHQLDPVAYPDPHEWQPSRHIKESTDEKGNRTLTAEIGTLRPFGMYSMLRRASSPWHLADAMTGGGSHMCKGRAFAARELIVFTAAILSMYDVQPVAGQKWGNRKSVKATSTKHPAKPVKAWIRRREVRQEKTGL